MRVKELPFIEKGLRRHVLITGSTGSGKTVAARYIIKQAAIYGVPSIVIDAQGDISSFVLRTRVGISVKARPRHAAGPQSRLRSNLQFDVNGDSTVNPSDFSYLIESILATVYGDANLDGSVDAIDLAHMRDNTGFPTSWADGSFDLNGVVDLGDLAQLRNAFGFTAPPMPVPEPATMLSMILLIVARRFAAEQTQDEMQERR